MTRDGKIFELVDTEMSRQMSRYPCSGYSERYKITDAHHSVIRKLSSWKSSQNECSFRLPNVNWWACRPGWDNESSSRKWCNLVIQRTLVVLYIMLWTPGYHFNVAFHLNVLHVSGYISKHSWACSRVTKSYNTMFFHHLMHFCLMSHSRSGLLFLYSRNSWHSRNHWEYFV